jgi:hypothetical protein
MRSPVYNSSILSMKMANRPLLVALHAFAALGLLFWFLFPPESPAFPAASWNEAEQQLARKIVAITGPGALALTVDNRSSLNKQQTDIIGNGLRAALEASGIRFVAADQAAAIVFITLSENQTSYVWVAEIRQGANERAVVMVSPERAESVSAPRDSLPLTLRRTSLWKQSERILDVAVLEEDAIPTHIAALDGEHVTLYRWRGDKWEREQSLAIAHARPWPRDLRGRLVLAKDLLLDVYLPGVVCRTTSGVPLSLNCHESDDPWPLVSRPLAPDVSKGPSGAISIPQFDAFFAPTRNFFTGVVSPRIGKFSVVPKFYSLAFIPRDKYVLWLFAAVDGQIHMIDGISDFTLKPGSDKAKWGSDLAGVHTSCGAGWQVLAVSAEGDEGNDSVRAYEFPDRDPVAVSATLDLPGEVTALWTEAKGDGAIAVARRRETGEYEAFRLSVACSQ